jgi:hypothetical protein
VRVSFEAVLRDPDGRTFAVPTIDVDEAHEFHHVEPVNSAVERLCGARVTTLRCLASERAPDDGRHRRYELEAHGPVRGLPEVEVDLPPPGNPWEKPGWYSEASAWISERVGAPIEQRSTRSISTFLRAGDTYFKAVPRIFATEPAITDALSRAHPGRVPEVLDVELERGWLLTRDFGDELLHTAALPTWIEALEAYADLQLAWVGRADELLTLGCTDRTLPRLDEQLDVVLADADAMLPARPDGLSDEELRALPELGDRLHATTAQMSEWAIPPTLDHGDLHAGNIALRDGRPLVFDWSDGCVSLPLISLTPILAWDGQPDDAQAALRDAYLKRIGAPPEAWDGAIALGLAHQAVSYHRITAGIAPHSRWEWEDVLPRIVKQLLERLGR